MLSKRRIESSVMNVPVIKLAAQLCELALPISGYGDGHVAGETAQVDIYRRVNVLPFDE